MTNMWLDASKRNTGSTASLRIRHLKLASHPTTEIALERNFEHKATPKTNISSSFQPCSFRSQQCRRISIRFAFKCKNILPRAQVIPKITLKKAPLRTDEQIVTVGEAFFKRLHGLLLNGPRKAKLKKTGIITGINSPLSHKWDNK